ncbi:MAG TPA: helix-turn-helix transcriptional regulator [Solirubrobacteraceae bacterium]|jgi:hypothetical protein
MAQPSAVQRAQPVGRLDVIADLQLDLVHRPRALLACDEQHRQDRPLDLPCHLARRTTTLLLHGKVLPFRVGPRGLNRGYYGDIERGERNVSLANILKVADALEVPASAIHARAEKLLSERH